MAVVAVAVCAMMVMGATEGSVDIQAKNIYAENLFIDGSLVIRSKEGKNLIYAGVDQDGNGVLSVGSKEGKGLIQAGVDQNGNGVLSGQIKRGKEPDLCWDK